jgi:hypothetical protein
MPAKLTKRTYLDILRKSVNQSCTADIQTAALETISSATNVNIEIVLEVTVSSVAHTLCGLQKKQWSPIQSQISDRLLSAYISITCSSSIHRNCSLDTKVIFSLCTCNPWVKEIC